MLQNVHEFSEIEISFSKKSSDSQQEFESRDAPSSKSFLDNQNINSSKLSGSNISQSRNSYKPYPQNKIYLELREQTQRYQQNISIDKIQIYNLQSLRKICSSRTQQIKPVDEIDLLSNNVDIFIQKNIQNFHQNKQINKQNYVKKVEINEQNNPKMNEQIDDQINTNVNLNQISDYPLNECQFQSKKYNFKKIESNSQISSHQNIKQFQLQVFESDQKKRQNLSSKKKSKSIEIKRKQIPNQDQKSSKQQKCCNCLLF